MECSFVTAHIYCQRGKFCPWPYFIQVFKGRLVLPRSYMKSFKLQSYKIRERGWGGGGGFVPRRVKSVSVASFESGPKKQAKWHHSFRGNTHSHRFSD